MGEAAKRDGRRGRDGGRPALTALASARIALAGGASRARAPAGGAARRAAAFLTDARRAPPVLGALLFAAAFLALPVVRFESAWSTELRAAPSADGAPGELLGASTASDGQWRFPPSESVSARFALAAEAWEDRRFRAHAGFDPRAVLRAFRDNARAGEVRSGGSTLSMQVVRLARAAARPDDPPARSLATKLVELVLSVRLELVRSKDEVLALWAAHAPFGGNVVGLEAASFRWFGRPPGELTWAEAATLAVLPNEPGLVHPAGDRERLAAKRDRLLDTLAARGALAPEALPFSRGEPLPTEPESLPALAPWLLAAASASGAAEQETTLDASLQRRLLELARRYAAQSRHADNYALVVARVDDGAVLAWVGNAPAPAVEAFTGQVDCASAPRSSGSILKPFLYAAMLDSGELAPQALVPDIPTRVGSFSPENYDKRFEGAVAADEALARSLNVPFVRLLRSYGVDRFHALLRGLGFGRLFRKAEDYGLSLVIGGAEVTLAEAAGAFADLARAAKGGPATVLGVSWRPRPAGAAAVAARYPFSAGAAALTLRALADAERPSEEIGWRGFASARRIAWKTGTSQGWRDGWAVGTDGDHVVAVWAGIATGEGRAGLTGGLAAAPLMFEAFGFLPRGSGFEPGPDAFRPVEVCADSGFYAGPDCPSVRTVQVPVDAPQADACPFCRLVHLSLDGLHRASADCVSEAELRTEKRFVLPAGMEWWYRRSRLDYRPLPPWLPGCGSEDDSPLAIVVPDGGSALIVPVELDGSPGMAVFSAVHRDPDARLFWHLDGDYLGETRGEHRIDARPAPGLRVLAVVDEEGRRSELRFTVLDAGD